jgi:FkbM family methyltransferase
LTARLRKLGQPVFPDSSNQSDEVVLVRQGENSFYVRKATCDEEVLRPRYGRSRFFAPGYRCRKHDIIVDVGAHIGVFAVAAARRVPHGRVYAMEPDKENFALLSRNAALNGLSNLIAHRIALSNRRGKAKLYYQKENWAHSICPPMASDDPIGSDLVSTDTLSNFIATHAISRIDYMKMNVEGAEYRVLLRASKRSLQHIGFMLVEFHPSAKHGANQLIDRLRSCGFFTAVTRSKEEPGKGWLTARFGY